jgi:hypothetical protein
MLDGDDLFRLVRHLDLPARWIGFLGTFLLVRAPHSFELAFTDELLRKGVSIKAKPSELKRNRTSGFI